MSAEMNAMDQTNLVLAKILQLALENGIRYWSLSFAELELESDYEDYFFPCVQWLEAEGLIRFDDLGQTMGGPAEGSVDNISLTSRGMAVLGQKIEIDGVQESIASAVKKVSAGSVNYHGIGDAIGGVLGGFVKSLGSG